MITIGDGAPAFTTSGESVRIDQGFRNMLERAEKRQALEIKQHGDGAPAFTPSGESVGRDQHFKNMLELAEKRQALEYKQTAERIFKEQEEKQAFIIEERDALIKDYDRNEDSKIDQYELGFMPDVDQARYSLWVSSSSDPKGDDLREALSEEKLPDQYYDVSPR